MANLVRINKYLAEAGICSRRKSDELIALGKITVNGELAKTGLKVNPEVDVVVYDGKTVTQALNKVYYALYKPRGVVSTVSDELGRDNVASLVPKVPTVYPVGRLDKNSEGLIILTNDGELTNLLTHPSNEHTKEYKVRVRVLNDKFDPNTVKPLFEKGLRIDKKTMKADSVSVEVIEGSNNLILTIVLHTGYNRQIRKMCDKISLEVLNLRRVRIAKLKLEGLNLKAGEYKMVDFKDIL